MLDNLRAMLTRPGFSDAESEVLRGVVSSLDKFSSENPRGSGAPRGREKRSRGDEGRG